MAKKLGIILLFIALGSGAIAYTATQSDDDSVASSTAASPQSTSPQSDQSTTPDQGEATQVASTGSYVEYSDDALASAEGKKVLFFHAPWCPQCRSVEAGIESEGVPEGFTILKVDYDSNQDLRAKYGVRLQTTFVQLDENNEKVDDFVAYNEPTFTAVKRDYLLKQ